MKSDQTDFQLGILSCVMLAGVVVYGGYEFDLKSSELENAEHDISKLEEALDTTEMNLDTALSINEELLQELKTARNKITSTKDILDEITGTVENLEKLRKLDPELLQKYSRVYFLNEHYVPSGLTEIPKKYLYDESKIQSIHEHVDSFLFDMIDAAEEDGVTLWVSSAYRSFNTQGSVKERHLTTYGSGANQFSADQGYSEHQLGTTVDFTTKNLSGALQGFETTPASKWMIAHAHEYGFSLSYPQGNAFYVYEPWHWRFVGVSLAKHLRKTSSSIYDLPQREIDAYLIQIFD